MCGLSGYIDFGNSSSPEILQRMTNCLAHRGPDDQGFEFREFGTAKIGFGFRRLSIIDLSPAGHQPMVNELNGDVMVFNGEIYNYRELKTELEEKGHRFHSESDSEVALRAFQQWGTRCVDRFRGMFVIVIFSEQGGKIHVFRDRPGVKPFYYFWDGSLFLFASELKSFHHHPGFKKRLDYDALGLYFHHGYIPAPYCIFENTRKLPAGYRLELNLKTKSITQHAYWSILNVFNKPKIDISYDEATLELEKIITESCNLRMRSDVPVGVFLSGGYDSSCVTALLRNSTSKPLKTFTIGFDNPQFDESPHARNVARYLGTDHYEYHCREKDAMDLIPRLPEIYDEPLADGGAIPNILVSQLAKEKVKVVLSADGGDEIFAGYTKHFYAKMQYERYFRLHYLLRKSLALGIDVVNYFRKQPLYEFDRLNRLQSFLECNDAAMLFNRLNQTFTEKEIDRFLRRKSRHLYNNFMNDHRLNKSNDEIDRIIAIDFQTYLAGDILPKVDRATSYVSIEGREPLLDHHIIEFAAILPSHFKLRNGEGKSILRNIVHRHLPKEIMHRPKMGFGLPIHHWGTKELKPLFDECFKKSFLKKQRIFSVKRVLGLYNHYQAGNMESFDRVYEFFIFQQWYRKWMM